MFNWALNTPLYCLFSKAHRMSTNLSTILSLFSAKLSDNSKILIMLYYHNRSTFQREKVKEQSRTSQIIESDSGNCNFLGYTHCPSNMFVPWNSLFLPNKPWVKTACCLSFIRVGVEFADGREMKIFSKVFRNFGKNMVGKRYFQH